jgi:hypothetical protein
MTTQKRALSVYAQVRDPLAYMLLVSIEEMSHESSSQHSSVNALLNSDRSID